MRLAIVAAALVFTTGDALAMDIPVDIDGKSLVVSASPLHRPIQPKDREAGNQQSALGCSFLYYGHLARADLTAAAALSTDPKATAEKLNQYRERIGADEFQKTMAAYFTAGNLALAELSLGTTVMLVVKSNEYTAGQFYVRQGDRWQWVERPPVEAARALGRVLNMIQSGQLKL